MLAKLPVTSAVVDVADVSGPTLPVADVVIKVAVNPVLDGFVAVSLPVT